MCCTRFTPYWACAVLILTAPAAHCWPQDTNQWGQDRKDGRNLATLLRELSAIEGLRWIRLLYCYPRWVQETWARRHGLVLAQAGMFCD